MHHNMTFDAAVFDELQARRCHSISRNTHHILFPSTLVYEYMIKAFMLMVSSPGNAILGTLTNSSGSGS